MRGSRVLRVTVLALVALGPEAGCGGGGGGSGCVPAADFPEGIDHGPVIGEAAPDSMTIAWWTTSPGTGAVEFSTDGSAWTRVDEADVRTSHRVTLDALDPDHAYRYRLLFDGVAHDREWTFRTPPPDGDSAVRFAVVGDTGTGCPEEEAVIARIAAEDPAFVLVTGDAAYSSGTPAEVRQGWSIPFADLLARVPVFVVLGNHDVQTLGGAPLLSAAVLPRNGPASGPARYWSADWGPVHLVGFDSNRSVAPGSEQGEWIAADLAVRTAPWCLVACHHPPYSSSNHGSTASLDRDLVPLLESARVDLAFAGHDHDYERTFPLRAGAPVDAGEDPDYVDPGAPVYVVTGGGGKDLYAAGHADFTAFSVSTFHAVIAEATPTSLSWRAVAPDGTLLDQASITRAP